MEKTVFTVVQAVLHKELTDIKKLNPRYFKKGIAQISVLPEHLELHTVGITRYIPAKTEGYFDVFIPLRFLLAYSKIESLPVLTLEVEQGVIRCGNGILTSPEIKVNNIFNATIDELPLNADEFDLLRYALRADPREIANYGLTMKVNNARDKLRVRITEAASILEGFRVSYTDLESLIMNKLKA
ncbi:MAG: hypothetical protein M0Q51_03175 [Bacteroidales bacterium]|nr:hypothetical protein [Bacteroidales bacterium]